MINNMWMQHIATLLGAACCMHLATVLRCVATCWVLLVQVWKWSNLSQQHTTCRNTLQHGGQTHGTYCVQQCCDMLHWHAVIIWPRLKGWIALEPDKSKLFYLVEFQQETTLSALSSAEHTSEIIGQNNLGSFCCYQIRFPAKYWKGHQFNEIKTFPICQM